MLYASGHSIFSVEELARVANQTRNRFEIMTPEERRMVLKVVAEKICIGCCEMMSHCKCDGGSGYRFGQVKSLSAAYARRTAGRPLSEKQRKLLRIVRGAGVRGIPAKAVAEKMGISPESAASSLSRFVGQEVLETVQREVEISSTRNGKRLVKFYRVPAGKEEVL